MRICDEIWDWVLLEKEFGRNNSSNRLHVNPFHKQKQDSTKWENHRQITVDCYSLVYRLNEEQFWKINWNMSAYIQVFTNTSTEYFVMLLHIMKILYVQFYFLHIWAVFLRMFFWSKFHFRTNTMNSMSRNDMVNWYQSGLMVSAVPVQLEYHIRVWVPNTGPGSQYRLGASQTWVIR